MFILTVSAALFGHAPGRVVTAFAISVLLGCVVGKVFPQKRILGIRDGQFLSTTIDRAKSFVAATAAWSGSAAVLAGFVSVVAALLRESDIEHVVGSATLWGGIIGSLAGALMWTASQTVDDVRVGQARMAQPESTSE